MSVGFDASGRAFRWLNTPTDGIQPQSRVSYVPQGVPPLDGEEQTLWNLFAGNSQHPLRSQILTRTLSIELAWTRLLRGDQPLTWTYADGVRGRITASRAIAQAIAACLDGADKQGAAISVPNLMDEDAQDALLAELAMAGFGNCYLIWRPVALALNWLHQTGQPPRQHKGSVWVVDFESAGIEVTRLNIEPHARDPKWLSPVRSYPTRTWDERPALRPCPPCDPLFAIWNAWLRSFNPQPNRITRQSLVIGPAASSLQHAIDENSTNMITAHAMSGPRIIRYEGTTRPLDNEVWSFLQANLQRLAPRHTTPTVGDTVLLHGWVPRLWPDEVRKAVARAWPGVITHVTDRDAVTIGAALYARRRAQNLPTYYDAVPEYRIWCKVAEAPPDFRTVIPATKTEPGEVITLNDDAIRNAFAIAAHRESLSVIVQRHPILNARTDFARRIRASLKRIATENIALRLDARIEAAHGNAKFTFTVAAGAKMFEGDLSSVELSYSRRGGAALEPEHKGYIEAQAVVGRIHDGPQGIAVLRPLVSFLEGRLEAENELAHALQNYRIDVAAAPNGDGKVKQALERWGWHPNPIRRQDTRGLFGTRHLDDTELSAVTDDLTNRLWAEGPGNHAWYNRFNWCQAYAGERYRSHIRSLLQTSNIDSWSKAFAPGFVLGSDPMDAKLLLSLARNHGFAFPDATYIAKWWWSCFRLLCWHPEARIDKEDAEEYLVRLCEHLDAVGIVAADQPKNALLAILFIMRAREKDPGALLPDSPVCQRVCNVINRRLPAVAYPPSMMAHMPGLAGNLSQFVLRFVRKEDTVADRELGAGIATMQ